MADAQEDAVKQPSSSLDTKDDAESHQRERSDETAEDSPLQNIIEIDYQPDCPVCLQPAFYPVKLPCGHIFCFLCIKGVALRSRKCAICRQAISTDVLEKPTLVKVSESKPNIASIEVETEKTAQEKSDYKWYYEGRNGWWQYDDKTSKEVESCFKSGKRSCTLLIAGFLYLIDFENMFQMRRNEPGRRRRIKRDKCDVESKGIAGIRKLASNISPTSSPTPDANSTSTETLNEDCNADRQAPVGNTHEAGTQGAVGSSVASSLDDSKKAEKN